MNIAVIFSPNWTKYVAVEMFALFKTNLAPIKVYIISDNLSEDDLLKFDNICNICGDGYTYEYINALDTYNKYITSTINVTSRFSKYTLYRLLLSYLINEDRVLYIDSDALVQGDISDFYNMDFNNNLLIGVADSGIKNEYKKKYNINIDSPYVNAGILLMNLNKIKELDITNKWIEMINKTKYPNPDQDVLNISCQNKIDTVGIEYNTSLSTGLQIKSDSIIICHYAGVKDKVNWVKKLPFSDIWDKWQKRYNDEIINVNSKIPKKIFYCWFGNGIKPEKIQYCIESWKKICPDYEVYEINESNFDINSNNYVREAYKQKKYAFVNDYCRFKYLYDYGGIYLDADVEILKPLDKFLQYDYVTSHEIESIPVCATTMSIKNHPYVKMLLDYYDDAPLNFGFPNTKIITKLSQDWIERKENGITYLKYGGIVFPSEVFAPFNHKKLLPMPTDNSYTIHHFMGSWNGRTKIKYKNKIINNNIHNTIINNNIDNVIEEKSIRLINKSNIIRVMKDYNGKIYNLLANNGFVDVTKSEYNILKNKYAYLFNVGIIIAESIKGN